MLKNPAQCLEGRTLNNGWRVEEKINHPATASGGHFSTSYLVRSENGSRAFLKAMDFAEAFGSDDPAPDVERLAAAYNFERRLLERCSGRRLSRVIGVLDAGTVRLDEENPYSAVLYLILELALRDVRSCIGTPLVRNISWVLQVMHQATAAVRQIHSVDIAHQDIKPSNLLLFSNTHVKLGDLGRASDRTTPSANDELRIAGDISYAPPELLYGHVSPDWRRRRLGGDMYLLGSLCVVLLSDLPMTHLLLTAMNREHRPTDWTGTYEEVLPYVESAFTHVLRDLRGRIRHPRSERVIQMIRELCNPDPAKRGHPKAYAQGTNPYALDRYVSALDVLYRMARIQQSP